MAGPEAVEDADWAGEKANLWNRLLVRPLRLRVLSPGEHVDVRPVRDALPTVDVGLVWRRGSGVKPAAAEFIELARDTSRARRG